MNLIGRGAKWLLILFGLFLAFFISGKFTPVVLAGCASGWHCVGTTVVDIPDGCQGPYGSGYCTQKYSQSWIYCDANCSGFKLSSCCRGNCSTYLCRTNTNCCEQDTGPYCGDGSCNGSEDCGSCSSDCGSCCSPSCSSPYCGQGDGCGGTCSTSSIGAGCGSPYCGQLDACGYSCGSSDAGAPAAPTLNPANGGTVTVAESADATVSWSAPALADSYYLELYPAGYGYSCSSPEKVYCGAIGSTTYSFIPLYPSYYYRVQGMNTTCATEPGAWAEAAFSVRGTITGTVKQDDNRQAVLIGDVCVLAGAGGIQPGAGSEVVVNGVDSGSVNVNGTYSLSSSLGSSKVAVLAIGDPTNWRCSCPYACIYSTTAPTSGLDYFVSNIKEPWWQVQEGNVHANSGNVRSPVPDTAALPYLITGSEAGLVSYSGSVDLGSGTINENGSAWQAQTIHKGLKTDYGYFKRILEDDPEAAANGVTIHEGDYYTDGEISVADGENMIILVDGNVTVTDNINVDPGGFLAIISSGNITIGNTVTNIEGVYISDGVIDSGTSESQLTGEGIFTGWLGISLNRDFNSTLNNTTPVERFIYRPDLVRNAYRYLLNSKISWQEVAP